MKCEECGDELKYDDAPVWRDIKIPFLKITLIIGKWTKLPHCPECIIDADRRGERAIYDAGYNDGYEKAITNRE